METRCFLRVCLISTETMNYSVLLERWVLRHMPVIVQPELDIDEGYGLVSVFYDYRHDENAMEFHYVFKVK